MCVCVAFRLECGPSRVGFGVCVSVCVFDCVCLCVVSGEAREGIDVWTFFNFLNFIFFCFVLFFVLCLFRAAPAAYVIPRLRVQLGLQPLTFARATATPDPSHVCDLYYYSSRQHRILNPLSKARD